MSRRNTISREFFSTIAVVLVLGLSVMCAIQRFLPPTLCRSAARR